MKFYLITQILENMPTVLEFNTEEELKKYTRDLGTAVAVNYNVYYVKFREYKIDEYKE